MVLIMLVVAQVGLAAAVAQAVLVVAVMVVQEMAQVQVGHLIQVVEQVVAQAELAKQMAVQVLSLLDTKHNYGTFCKT
jgi:hypothetical protein